MSEPVSIGLVAIGGYGNFYAGLLLDNPDPASFRIVGVVDPMAARARRFADLEAQQVPMYPTLEAFYAEHSADLVTIASPIQLHCPQTCTALANGSNVLCEKPLGATIQEAHAMIAARDRAGKFVGIGYQWSFSAAVQALKRDVMAGDFGRPQRLKTLVAWPRTDAYYARNNWAGAKQDQAGNWILDSPVNNATAHYLHNMFYCIGAEVDRSAVPSRLVAELYRANTITNYDTAVCRCVTTAGVEMLYVASHAVRESRGPEFRFEFENGTATLSGPGAPIEAVLADGTSRTYGDPNQDAPRKLWDAIAAVRGKTRIVCGPEAASSQTLCMNGMQESMPGIVAFPRDLVHAEGEPGKRVTCVDGLEKVLAECYERFRLPSEIGTAWASPGLEVDLTHYRHFPAPAAE